MTNHSIQLAFDIERVSVTSNKNMHLCKQARVMTAGLVKDRYILVSGQSYSRVGIEVSSLYFLQLEVGENLPEHDVEYLYTLRVIGGEFSSSLDGYSNFLLIVLSYTDKLSDLVNKERISERVVIQVLKLI